jgi:predicted HTH transcriptional regulator
MGSEEFLNQMVKALCITKDGQTILEKLNLQEDKKLKKAAILLFGKNPQRFYP